jgi:protein-disulfide isomerase
MSDLAPKQENKAAQVIILVVLTIFCLLIFAVFFSINQNPQIEPAIKTDTKINQTATTGQKPLFEQKIIEGESMNWLGTSTPKLTIVEFADFACPYCKNSNSLIREIGTGYGNKIKIIYRNYLAHEESLTLALAAQCAGEQEKFWEMHDKLFQNQGVQTVDEVTSLAKQLGLNMEKFSSCLESQKYLPLIQKDADDAETLSIVGTPTWFFNGQKIQGEIPKLDFIKLINELIK